MDATVGIGSCISGNDIVVGTPEHNSIITIVDNCVSRDRAPSGTHEINSTPVNCELVLFNYTVIASGKTDS